MKESNEWANPDATGAENIAGMITRLEERARCPDQRQVNAEFLEVLAPKAGEFLVEVGPGSGILCRQAALQVVTGKVVGIDISAEMCKAARQYSVNAQMSPITSFTAGRGENLPFASDTFDGVFGARLLLHAAEPGKVVKEMSRVVRPLGRVVVMDWDFETVTVDHSDRKLTRRILHWRTDHLGGDNWSGRKLLGLMARAGLKRLSVQPRVSLAHGEQDSLTQSLWNASQAAKKAGIITLEEQRSWERELKEAIAANQFLASIVYFIVRGEKD